ncbi:gentisate 1,2-dioxygenase [Ectopseudomonas mendocina]|uniref:Gentisate 1,2-dioxygenase n=1 Tax=Ectopseudomonas mendocina TaxID=300 RepID=A0ABZ2RSA8_ECTME
MDKISKGQRADYYERIERQHLSPLWESLHQLVPTKPIDACVPVLWRYQDVRPYLIEAGELISAEEAIRRVLILENPALRGLASTTSTLYAGLQLILPGETAPSHRHTQSALRLVVEGRGAYTVVNGERTTMEPGDFIITPSWAWHDHGNTASEGAEPVVWLDGLDIPIVRFLNAGFAQNGQEDSQPIRLQEGTSFARFGHNMVPVNHRHKGRTSPIFNYPYARSREALDNLLRFEEIDPCYGVKLTYTNPLTGSWAMPSIAAFIQLLPAGFDGLPSRSTDATVYVVVEGKGRATVGQQLFTFEEHDVFVVPSWVPVSFACAQDVVLFSFSDRPVQEFLGLWRESLQ